MLDLRLPMGLMFSLVGAILAIYGAITNGDVMYEHSLRININIWWGTALLAFGLIMLGLAWWASAAEKGAADEKK